MCSHIKYFLCKENMFENKNWFKAPKLYWFCHHFNLILGFFAIKRVNLMKNRDPKIRFHKIPKAFPPSVWRLCVPFKWRWKEPEAHQPTNLHSQHLLSWKDDLNGGKSCRRERAAPPTHEFIASVRARSYSSSCPPLLLSLSRRLWRGEAGEHWNMDVYKHAESPGSSFFGRLLSGGFFKCFEVRLQTEAVWGEHRSPAPIYCNA